MPVMERVAEETVATNNIQLKARVDDVPCNKLDARHNDMVIQSETANSDCPGSSAHRNVDLTKPPPPEEAAGAKLSVEELTLGNYRIVQGSNNTNVDSPRAGKFEHLYRLARGSAFRAGDGDLDSQPRDMDQMLSRIRQQLAGAPSERQNLKPFMSRRSDQNLEAFSERLRAAGENSIMNAPALISEGVQMKTPVSSSNFSQLLLKRAMKGKGVVGKNQETPPEFVSDQDLGSKEKKLDISKSPTPHDVLPLKSSPKGNGMVSHGDGNHSKSSIGISLREFLRSSYAKREKRHGLCLFRQLVELVDSAHSKRLFLLDLRPSLFTLVPSKKLRYIGNFGKNDLESDVDEDLNRRRPVVEESSSGGRDSKKRKMDLHLNSPGNQLQATSTGRPFKRKSPVIDLNMVDARNPDSCELQQQDYIKNLSVSSVSRKQSMSTWLEEQWYTCPEEINGEDIGEKSNIYALGVLLFELLCHCESGEMHAAMMADLRHRILPPTFLSKYPKEAGFCLWLLHPEPSSRPSARDILKSELICEDDSVKSTAAAEEISELLLHFLSSLEVQKKKKASKLLQDIQTLEDDIKEAERRYSSNVSLVRSHGAIEKRVQSSPLDEHCTTSSALFVPTANTDRLMSNIRQLEDAYFFMRSQINLSSSAATARSDKTLKDRDRCSENQNENQDMSTKGKSSDQLEVFFEGLCKFARYSKFETCGTIRSGDLLNSASVVCSLSFDPDEEHIAAAGISKKIKIFDFNAFMNESVGVHYPLVEMVNKSKLSCVCWNSYIKNYLASTDYDGVVQIWDAGTGQGCSQYTEHQKRAWSVDFSPSDPTKFVSGSDDCSVKLWSINEKRSLGTIWSPANVCCVQFSSYSNHLLAFGSADYKVYCYDLRYVKTPWCTLAGHEKAVSYVKFMDSETIVSASTDNSLKLWNLNKTNSSGLSPGACSLTYKGHTNQKNFVGLSVLDGYIACGSETNEVYSYYKSLPMPMTSYKFGSVDPISGNEYFDDNGQFVSSVCWRKKSNMLVAANSTGNMKLLKLV
ncbi:unnamed protein product [Arabidopsis thaliana]|uniref:Protein kinase domain-containing protein n=1 Tax=Arabidopsis thaliana TaxID=3702 RepID=A0A5S9X7G0_ARATH|nr:unnamed protein product [Arabidopsis thaliana]